MPIRPITLIYGPNSAGKSSLIHSLLLARHALDTGDLDVRRTTIGGDAVDLGGFRQYVHRRDESSTVEWGVEFGTASLTGRIAELLDPVKTVGVTLSIGLGYVDESQLSLFGDLTRVVERIKKPRIETFVARGDGRSFLTMSARRDGTLRLDTLDHEHPVFRELVKAIVTGWTTLDTIRLSDHEVIEKTFNDLVPEISAAGNRFPPDALMLRGVPLSPKSGKESLIAVPRGERPEGLASAIETFFPHNFQQLFSGLSHEIVRDLARVSYLGPLRSYPPRHLAFEQDYDPNWYAGGGQAWHAVRGDEEVRNAVNRWLGSADRLQTPYELTVRNLISDGVLSKELPDLFSRGLHDFLRDVLVEAAEKGAGNVDENGLKELARLAQDLLESPDQEMNPDVEDLVSRLRDVEAAASEWAGHLVEAGRDELKDLILIDKRNNTPVSHRDVGIGISQVLPVLVSAYASKGKILAMEQPEIHLHPKLQAELGDVFIESALGDRKNTFIIETHSEHLILRLMRRMRETSNDGLPDGLPPVRPEDVAVLYVQPKGTTAVVLERELDEEGTLLDPWPNGFFEEGFRERFA